MKLVTPILLLLLSGCSPFSIFQTSKEVQKIPNAPTRQFDQIEDVRKEVGIVTDLSNIANNVGLLANSKESNTLLSSAKTLQTITGLPTEPVLWSNEKEVKELHENLLAQEKEYRLKKAEWEAKINALDSEHSHLQKENGFLKSALDKFKFWFWVVVIILGALCFFVPTVGIPFVRFLIGRVKKTGEIAIAETASALKRQLGQVVNAIEDHKRNNPEDAKKLLNELSKKTDSHTRKLINELKN